MALRGKPSLRGPLGALFVLNLCGGLAASCGDPQAPSFQAKAVELDDATRLEERNNSADAVAANPETLDIDKLKERAEELGVDLEEELAELEDLSDSTSEDNGQRSGNSQAGNDSSDGNSGNGSDSGTDSSDDVASSDPVTPGSEGNPDLPSDSADDSSDDSQTADNSSPSSGSGSSDDGSSGNDSSDSSGSDDTADNSAPPADDSSSEDEADMPSNGNEPPPTFELYSQDTVQPEVRPVDILWVIDSSGSMAEEQNYLAQNFDSMVNALVDAGASFQTAVTTTDICNKDGSLSAQCPVDYGGSASTRLRGSFIEENGSQVLDGTDPNVVSKFSNYTKVGTTGSGFEHGLEAVELAVKKSEDGRNEKLVRENAFLSVIVVSDEEDDGIGLGQKDGYSDINYVEKGLTDHSYTHNDLIDYLKGVKGEGNFAISTVTGTRDSNGNLCTSHHSSPYEEGTNYINAAKATGGTIQSICDDDWSSSLGFIGQDIKAQITQISLEKEPFVQSIKVKVNGTDSNNWVYLEASNSVKFDKDHIPAPGASIAIEYYAAP